MKFDNKVWLTLYQDEFQRDEYLYHYTSVEKATTILNGNSLRFSKITTMNDTLEAKPKMSLIDISADNNLKEIFKQINEINQKFIQLLCFVKDTNIEKHADKQLTCLSDYSGRGFALPRMWAQYAHNNDGVCFIFNKRKLLNIIHKEIKTNLIYEGDIKYVSQYTALNFNYEESFNSLFGQKGEFNKTFAFANFLKENQSYTQYNYFYKLDDWSNENEFRILACGDENIFVNDIVQALVGIIIGEQIKPVDEKIIKYFCQDICEIKKIDFSYNGCALTNIYNEEE